MSQRLHLNPPLLTHLLSGNTCLRVIVQHAIQQIENVFWRIGKQGLRSSRLKGLVELHVAWKRLHFLRVTPAPQSHRPLLFRGRPEQEKDGIENFRVILLITSSRHLLRPERAEHAATTTPKCTPQTTCRRRSYTRGPASESPALGRVYGEDNQRNEQSAHVRRVVVTRSTHVPRQSKNAD